MPNSNTVIVQKLSLPNRNFKFNFSSSPSGKKTISCSENMFSSDIIGTNLEIWAIRVFELRGWWIKVKANLGLKRLFDK